jgi:uncharacterized protein YggE
MIKGVLTMKMKLSSFVALSILLSCISLTNRAYSTELNDVSLIDVSTSGVAKSLPDQVEIHVTFSSFNIEAEKGRKDVSGQVTPFLKALEAYDIEENSLDSSQVRLYPRYDYNKNHKELLGYDVSRNITFKLNTLSQLETLVQIITKNKASQISSLNFGLRAPQKLKRQAIKKAISKARREAQLIADGFEVKLGKVHKIVYSDNGRSGPNLRSMAMSAELSHDSSNTYHQKEIEYKANIFASFLIDGHR